MSAVLGIVAFAFLAVVVLMLDKSNILSSINALMGASIEDFTVSKLLSLSGLFAVLLAVSRTIIKVLWVLISNAAMTMLGGIEIVLQPQHESIEGDAPTDTDAKSSGRTVSSAHNGERA
jgi:hypothetical protein